jgi:hypothetical protein
MQIVINLSTNGAYRHENYKADGSGVTGTEIILIFLAEGNQTQEKAEAFSSVVHCFATHYFALWGRGTGGWDGGQY